MTGLDLPRRRAEILRGRGLDVEGRRVLLTRFSGSAQEADLSEPPNCGGLGRLRHFRRATSAGWPENPLPIDPAANSLGLPRTDMMLAQAFQNAICDWRCWYCFVPFELLSANQQQGEWIDARSLVDRYLAESPRAPMIDLTGGQPDLTPEWTLWMAQALSDRGAADSTFLWVDDNLSSDYYWRHLSAGERSFIRGYPHFARVGCFKGFDAESFAFNTGAPPEGFDGQFDIFARHLAEGDPCYAYVTLTSPSDDRLEAKLSQFVDRLQGIHPNLPLRTVPLEIAVWGPVHARLREDRTRALSIQRRAVAAWNAEIALRFSAEMRAIPVYDVDLT